MNKVAWVIVGLLAGLLIATAVPVGAHHARSARRLANRVERLETQMANVRARTQLMDADGFYAGPVFGFQVLSFCTSGAAAVWETSEVEPTVSALDDCFVGQQAKRTRALRSFTR